MVLYLSFIPTWCHPQIVQYPQTGRLQLIPNKLYWGLSFLQTFPNTKNTINILRAPRLSQRLVLPANPQLWSATHDCQSETFLTPTERCMAYWKTSIKADSNRWMLIYWGNKQKEKWHIFWEAVKSSWVARQEEII